MAYTMCQGSEQAPSLFRAHGGASQEKDVREEDEEEEDEDTEVGAPRRRLTPSRRTFRPHRRWHGRAASSVAV